MPGKAYMFESMSEGTLNYPDNSASRAVFTANEVNYDAVEGFDYRKYEFNGSITASIDIADVVISRSDKLFAYIDGECRGYAQPAIFPLTDKYIFPLMVYSSLTYEENMVLEYYNAHSDTYYDISESFAFEADMRPGNGLNPVVLNGENDNAIIFCTGSLYLVGEILNLN